MLRAKSVPSLNATWDGEPCPVHGQELLLHPGQPLVTHSKQFGSVIDMRNGTLNPRSSLGMAQEMRKYPGSPIPLVGHPLHGAGTPTHLIGSPLTNHPPLAISGFSEQVMPMRIKTKHHNQNDYYNEAVCCKGHLIVLWVILAVVTVGVISGIILGITMN